MKTYKSVCLQIAAFALAFAFVIQARAAGPREELVHAYILLKMANHNYAGHRVLAMKELEIAGHDLGLDLRGHGSKHEQQLKSDELLAEAGRILHYTRDRLDAHDRERAADHVDRAMHEIDLALRVK